MVIHHMTSSCIRFKSCVSSHVMKQGISIEKTLVFGGGDKKIPVVLKGLTSCNARTSLLKLSRKRKEKNIKGIKMMRSKMIG